MLRRPTLTTGRHVLIVLRAGLRGRYDPAGELRENDLIKKTIAARTALWPKVETAIDSWPDAVNA